MYDFLIIFFKFLYHPMDESGNISSIEQYVIDFIIRLRKSKGLTQEDIAVILGVGRTFITNVENPDNRAKYNINHINLLADHFGLSPKDFLPEKPIL